MLVDLQLVHLPRQHTLRKCHQFLQQNRFHHRHHRLVYYLDFHHNLVDQLYRVRHRHHQYLDLVYLLNHHYSLEKDLQKECYLHLLQLQLRN